VDTLGVLLRRWMDRLVSLTSFSEKERESLDSLMRQKINGCMSSQVLSNIVQCLPRLSIPAFQFTKLKLSHTCTLTTRRWNDFLTTIWLLWQYLVQKEAQWIFHR
jgi:hypothetical protein